jgi:hypothetical protein
MPTGPLRTMAQPPNELLHGDRHRRDADDCTAEEHPEDIAIMLTGRPKVNAVSRREQHEGRKS